MPSVLITGGAGYIGSILTKMLLDANYQVTVLDNFLFKQNSLLDCCNDPNFSIIRGDCRNESVLKKAIIDKDIIIPLAALVGSARFVRVRSWCSSAQTLLRSPRS